MPNMLGRLPSMLGGALTPASSGTDFEDPLPLSTPTPLVDTVQTLRASSSSVSLGKRPFTPVSEASVTVAKRSRQVEEPDSNLCLSISLMTSQLLQYVDKFRDFERRLEDFPAICAGLIQETLGEAGGEGREGVTLATIMEALKGCANGIDALREDVKTTREELQEVKNGQDQVVRDIRELREAQEALSREVQGKADGALKVQLDAAVKRIDGLESCAHHRSGLSVSKDGSADESKVMEKLEAVERLLNGIIANQGGPVESLPKPANTAGAVLVQHASTSAGPAIATTSWLCDSAQRRSLTTPPAPHSDDGEEGILLDPDREAEMIAAALMYTGPDDDENDEDGDLPGNPDVTGNASPRSSEHEQVCGPTDRNDDPQSSHDLMDIDEGSQGMDHVEHGWASSSRQASNTANGDTQFDDRPVYDATDDYVLQDEDDHITMAAVGDTLDDGPASENEDIASRASGISRTPRLRTPRHRHPARHVDRSASLESEEVSRRTPSLAPSGSQRPVRRPKLATHATNRKASPVRVSGKKGRQNVAKVKVRQRRSFGVRPKINTRCLPAGPAELVTNAGRWPQKCEYTIVGRLREIVCDACKARVHWFCAGFEDDDLAPDGEWICPECTILINNGTPRGVIEVAQQQFCLRADCLMKKKGRTVRKEGDEDVYYPERVVGRRFVRRKGKEAVYDHLMKWLDWDTVTSTWEPPENVSHLGEMLAAFREEACEELECEEDELPKVALLSEAQKYFSEETGELRDEYAESSVDEDAVSKGSKGGSPNRSTPAQSE